MNSNNRESHCTGKAHKAKAAEGRVGSGSSGSAGGGNGGMADRSPLRSKSPLPLAAGSWRCEVCDKTMNSNNRESHCAGKAHKAKDGQAGGRGGGGRGRGGMGGDGREVVEGDNGGGGSSNSSGCSCLIPVWEAHVRRIKWKCIVCEEYMKASATKAHRASRKHRDNLPYASGTQQCKDCLASTEESPESPIYLASSSHGLSSHDSIMRYWAPDSDSGEDDKWVGKGPMYSYRSGPCPLLRLKRGGQSVLSVRPLHLSPQRPGDVKCAIG
ncbi:hypothetical protein BD779DRAFT_594206 [Infundibulicybe gibba]|nr:hypothetical protein BD779DRAFT_594206 [Infundibulicybe gibba]